MFSNRLIIQEQGHDRSSHRRWLWFYDRQPCYEAALNLAQLTRQVNTTDAKSPTVVHSNSSTAQPQQRYQGLTSPSYNVISYNYKHMSALFACLGYYSNLKGNRISYYVHMPKCKIPTRKEWPRDYNPLEKQKMPCAWSPSTADILALRSNSKANKKQ